MRGSEVSRSLLLLPQVAKEKQIELGNTVLDMGCGNGRNGITLAQQGYQVFAFDFVPDAITRLTKRAAEAGVPINAQVARMDAHWPYPDKTFDWILDDTASMSIESQRGREVCRDELYRTLKPGGYVVVYVFSADTPHLHSPQHVPGEEKNTVITPDGKVEKLYTPEEQSIWYNQLHLVHQERLVIPSLGDQLERRTIWTIFQKPGEDDQLRRTAR